MTRLPPTGYDDLDFIDNTRVDYSVEKFGLGIGRLGDILEKLQRNEEEEEDSDMARTKTEARPAQTNRRTRSNSQHTELEKNSDEEDNAVNQKKQTKAEQEKLRRQAVAAEKKRKKAEEEAAKKAREQAEREEEEKSSQFMQDGRFSAKLDRIEVRSLSISQETFVHQTGEWHSKEKWEKMPSFDTIFSTRSDILAYIAQSKIFECIPVMEPLQLTTLQDVKVETGLGSAYISPYFNLVFKCAYHYYKNFPEERVNMEPIVVLWKMEKYKSDRKYVGLSSSEKDMYTAVSQYGLVPALELICACLIPQSCLPLADLMEGVTAKECMAALTQIQTQCPGMYSLFQLWVRVHNSGKKSLHPFPLIFSYNDVLDCYIEKVTRDSGEEENIVISLPMLDAPPKKRKSSAMDQDDGAAKKKQSTEEAGINDRKSEGANFKEAIGAPAAQKADKEDPFKEKTANEVLKRIFIEGGEEQEEDVEVEQEAEQGKEDVQSDRVHTPTVELSGNDHETVGESDGCREYSPTWYNDSTVVIDKELFDTLIGRFDQQAATINLMKNDLREVLLEEQKNRDRILSLTKKVDDLNTSLVGVASQRSYSDLTGKRFINKALFSQEKEPSDSQDKEKEKSTTPRPDSRAPPNLKKDIARNKPIKGEPSIPGIIPVMQNPKQTIERFSAMVKRLGERSLSEKELDTIYADLKKIVGLYDKNLMASYPRSGLKYRDNRLKLQDSLSKGEKALSNLGASQLAKAGF